MTTCARKEVGNGGTLPEGYRIAMKGIDIGWRIAAVALVATILASCRAGEFDPESVPEAQEMANRAVDLLCEGDYEAVAELLHYPPSYTPEQLATDKADVRVGLELLAGEVGLCTAPEPQNQPVEFYQVGVSGGDVPYWQSLPNGGLDQSYRYKVRYGKLGDGIVQVTLVEESGKWAVRSVDLGLETAREGAREIMLDLGEKLAAALTPLEPGDFRKRADGVVP